MIVLAARLTETLFGQQIVISMHKKWSRSIHLALRSIISNFKYSYCPENAKKKKLSFRRHFNEDNKGLAKKAFSMLRAWKQKKKEGSMPCVMILWDANFLQKTFLAIRV